MRKTIYGTAAAVLLLTAGICLNAWSDTSPCPLPGGQPGGFHGVRDHGPFGYMMGRHGMMEHHMGSEMLGGTMGLVRMSEKLGLSPDQRDKIGKIMDDARPKMRDLMFKMMDTHKQAETLSAGDGKVDDARLRQLADQQGKLMSDMMYLSMKSRADMRAVLTDAQRQKLDRFRGSWHDKNRLMKDRGSRRDMRGAGPRT